MSLSGAGGGSGYASPWPSQQAISELEMENSLGELVDTGFEPQTRARSNTWPCPRPENYIEPINELPGSTKNSNQHLSTGGAQPQQSSGSVTAKKNSSRRNAWGNLSYADLITQAITSAADNRLTLSQIYEWMVQNVAYFKDKGDSNSSAGWKNSIRHNLSLHNRFMRVQNEGTGKSSWWMINPDAKPGKSVRRRAASMETSKFEKRRGRVKKKAENLRNGVSVDATPSPSSSVSEGLDMFPDDSPMHSGGGYQLSPDFRQRASSNASSCGRLSPIPSIIQSASEPDWATDYTPAGDFAGPDFSTEFTQQDFQQSEQLAGNLADNMKLNSSDPFLSTYVPTTMSSGTGGSGYRAGATGYAYAACPRHPHGGCSCPSLYPAHPAHSHHHQQLDHFARPPPPADPADMHTDPSVMGGSVMVQSGSLVPTTMMGQLMGALNTTTVEDLNLNIESLDHGFDCNVDEVIKHELSMEGTLDFNFPQQASAASEDVTFATPAPPVAASTHAPTDPLRSTQHTPYTVAPSWVH